MSLPFAAGVVWLPFSAWKHSTHALEGRGAGINTGSTAKPALGDGKAGILPPLPLPDDIDGLTLGTLVGHQIRSLSQQIVNRICLFGRNSNCDSVTKESEMWLSVVSVHNVYDRSSYQFPARICWIWNRGAIFWTSVWGWNQNLNVEEKYSNWFEVRGRNQRSQ